MKKDFKALIEEIKFLDKKVVTIFISVAVLQTISYYYTSRHFFRNNFYEYFFESFSNTDLLEFIYWFVSDTFVLLVIPLIIVLFIFKEKPTRYGFSIGKGKVGLKYLGLSLIIMITIIWITTSSSEFAKQYPMLKSAANSWGIFFVYQTGLLLFIVAWEFIWRGYMLFGLEEKFGVYAVLIQMLPFVILHNGKPDVETFGAILGGIALGILAMYTRSIIYGIAIHFGVMFSIDFISILRLKADNYQIGIDGIIKVIGKLF